MVVFYYVNVYEEDGCIVFDVIVYEDNSFYQFFYLVNLNQDFKENIRFILVFIFRRFVVFFYVDKNVEVGLNLIKVVFIIVMVLKEEDG